MSTELPQLSPLLEEAVGALGIAGDIKSLRSAAGFSRGLARDAQGHLRSAVPPTDEFKVDVVALGSIAREEAAFRQSDFDYLVVAYELAPAPHVRRTRELLAAAEEFRKDVALEEPGGTGMFGQVVAAPELTERIGLQHDTNVTHTHRLLLLEESVSIYQPELHDKLLEAVLARYLIDYEVAKKGVPRFLLNDVERYWRTLCVDYQAKRWGLRTPDGWGLRYLKLIISRKLAFVGTMTSILLCDEATPAYFVEQFKLPPLARFAQVHNRLEDRGKDGLRQALLIAEEFSASLADKDFRTHAKTVGEFRDIAAGSPFDKMRTRARELQRHLEAVFYDPALEERSRTYLSF